MDGPDPNKETDIAATVVQGGGARPTVMELVSLEKPGDMIGPYKLLSIIGEGGFGTVWLAEQSKPVHRRVAVKVVKAGMDTKAVLARFEAERQALAMMEHPNIARVFEAGATAQGRPYFAMEHIPGIPITEHCDRQRLPVKARLELFAQVCDAIHHAHMKGVIHRDLKPGNILVMQKDQNPAAVKIIDFGVAKAIQHKLTEKTIFTEIGVLVGTPEYMSPEQAEMTAQDIDTRSDIYSLGVVLYELLVGEVPFDSKELRSKGYAEIQRIIREVDPPRPSTRLTKVTPATTTIADARRTRIVELTSLLRRELEWIPMKAMQKDRAERYRSAAEMADDLRRYLDGKPIIAKGEGWTYLTRKFARRHRWGIGAVAAVFLALIIGLGLALWQWRESRARYRQVLVLARSNIDLQSSIGDQVGSSAASRLLVKSSQSALNGLASVAKPDSDLHDLLARGYSALGGLERDSRETAAAQRAIDAFKEALARRRTLASASSDLGPRTDVGFAMVDLANAQSSAALSEASVSIRDAVATSADLLAGHPGDPGVRRLRAAARRAEGRHLIKSDTPDAATQAKSAFEESASILAALRTPSDAGTNRDYAAALLDVGECSERAGDAATAESKYAEAISVIDPLAGSAADSTSIQRTCMAAHTRLGHLLINGSFKAKDRFDEVALHLDKAGRIAIKLAVEDPFSETNAAALRSHYEMEGDAIFMRGYALMDEGKTKEALALLRKSLEFLTPFLEQSDRAHQSDPEIPSRSYTLAVACEKLADAHRIIDYIEEAASAKDDAIKNYRRAADLYKRAVESETTPRRRERTGVCLMRLAGLYDDLKRWDDVVATNAEALQFLEGLQAAPADREWAIRSLSFAARNLGFVLLDEKHDPPGAVKALLRARDTMTKEDRRPHMVYDFLGRAYAALSPPDNKNARAAFDAGIAAYRAREKPDRRDHQYFIEISLAYGRLLASENDADGAKAHWREGLEAFKLVDPADPKAEKCRTLRDQLAKELDAK